MSGSPPPALAERGGRRCLDHPRSLTETIVRGTLVDDGRR